MGSSPVDSKKKSFSYDFNRFSTKLIHLIDAIYFSTDKDNIIVNERFFNFRHRI